MGDAGLHRAEPQLRLRGGTVPSTAQATNVLQAEGPTAPRDSPCVARAAPSAAQRYHTAAYLGEALNLGAL